MKRNYTDKQITEAISYWANYLLESKMADEDEVKDLLGEGWLRRIGHGIKSAAKKTKELAHKLNWLPQKAWDKVFKPNKGMEMLLSAMDRIGKKGENALKGTNLFATVPGKVYPIIGFTLLKHKTVLALLVNKSDTSAKPKTLQDLRKFFNDAEVNNIAAAVDSIRMAEAPESLSESILLEANAVDRLIDDNGWTKKQALKPENLKLLKKAFKQNEEKTIAQVEKHFAAKSSSKTAPKKSSTKAKPSKKKTSTKKAAPSSSDTTPTTSSPSSEPSPAPSDADPSFGSDSGSTAKKDPADAIKVFDNDLVKVVPDNKVGDKNLGFIFTKTKAEIAIDKKEADLLSH